jgi:hypothetical protein
VLNKKVRLINHQPNIKGYGTVVKTINEEAYPYHSQASLKLYPCDEHLNFILIITVADLQQRTMGAAP